MKKKPKKPLDEKPKDPDEQPDNAPSDEKTKAEAWELKFSRKDKDEDLPDRPAELIAHAQRLIQLSMQLVDMAEQMRGMKIVRHRWMWGHTPQVLEKLLKDHDSTP